MDLYSWFTSSSDPINSTELVTSSSSSSREPPEFLKLQKTGPPQRGDTREGSTSPGTTEEYTLTPLESRLKDIIVNVYSDKQKSKPKSKLPKLDIVSCDLAASEPKSDLSELCTGSTTLQQCDLSTCVPPNPTVASLPDTTAVEGTSQHKTASLETAVNIDDKQLWARSNPDGSDSPGVLTSTRPEDQQGNKFHSFTLFSKEGEGGIPSPPATRKVISQGDSPTHQSKVMSDTHSTTSTEDVSSSAPIFSADDQNIELVDPDFPPIAPSTQLGSLPYSSIDSQSYLRDNRMDGGNPQSVPLDFSSSLLYSFTDPSSNSLPTLNASGKNKDPKTGIVNSFGIPPQLFQPRLAKPRPLNSVPFDHASHMHEDTDGGGLQSNEPGVTNDSPLLPRGPGVPELTTPLPDVRAESKDTTPTPESVRDTPEDAREVAVSDAQHLGEAEPVVTTTQQDLAHFRPSLPLSLPAESVSSASSDPEQVPVVTSLDSAHSDVETASVVSVQQLTETYLNEPLDPLPGSLTPLSEGGRIPFLFPSATSSDPSLPTQASSVPPGHSPVLPHSTRELPRVQNKLSQHVAEHPGPGRLPAHINPSVSKKAPPSSPQSPAALLTSGPNDIPSPVNHVSSNSDAASAKLLEGKLMEEQKARTFLEGQLEAVKEECEAALQERPVLLSKLSKMETELAETASALERERSKPVLQPGVDARSSKEALKDLKDTREGLEREKEAAANLRGKLREEEQKCRQLSRAVKDTKQTLADQESNAAELIDKYQKCHAEMTKKAEEADEMACKLSSLEAGYSALEENKSWLHDQLQDAQKAKLDLQAELRDSKASGIARDIKCDQLQKENSALQEQISDLLKGVLQDKAKMVNQLETIKEDMVSSEDLYTDLVASKTQLEDIIKRKNEVISQLNSDLARAQVEREELKQRFDEVSSENDKLAHQASDLQRANKSLSNKLAASQRDLEEKESDLKEVEKIKSSLQNKLRQTDVDTVGKDGTIQSLKDASELLKHELALITEAKEGVERENAEVKSELATLEAELKSTLGKCKEKDLLLTSQHSADDEKQLLQDLLAEKNREVEQKDEAIKALESQTNELLGEFSTLRENFQSMASESGSVSSNLSEKDRVISHLAAEKDRLEEELRGIRNEDRELREKLEVLQHERAHLLGKVEGSVEQEDYRRTLQDKAQLQDELNTLRVEQKRDEIKALSKISQLEGELKATQKSAIKAEKDLQAVKDEKSDEVSRSNEARHQAEADLKETREKLQRAIKDKDKAESMLGSLRPSEQQLQDLLKSKCEQLKKQNHELMEQLQQATQQKIEVERASGLVASKLKQNADREKKELMEKNRDISLDLERLRGRLAGMHTTQVTIRDHATSLEVALAKKESAIVKLSAESQKILEDKQREDRAFEAQITTLEKQLEDMEANATQQQEKASSEKLRADELERELRQCESVSKQAELSKRDSSALSTMKDKLASLTLEKDALQSDVSYLKSQLLIAKTAATSAKRQVTDKISQVEILERELKIAKSQSEEAEEEVRKLKEHLRMSDSRRQARGEEPRRGGEVEGRRSLDRESVSSQGKGKDRLFEASLSSISGIEDTDQSDLGAVLEGGSSSDVEKVARLSDTLRELGSRVVQARQQGAEAVELKKSGEISVLQKELGSKSRTLNTLQSYLHSLKDDMNKLHQQMDHHSATMKESYKSSRLIESQIEDLRRNSSLPSPLMLSTPTEQSQ